MYIATFYSFKGGVGRSMSLVNVAVELAKAGQKVLLVDFDLEAPGLSTFDVLAPPKSYKGIVEFVTDYKRSNESPDVADYLYKVDPLDEVTGNIWVMPAGMANENYSEKLNSINWTELYEQQNGFLLFEDLKEQWKSTIAPDYVLIDSRTGYTDVAGICTRQLPDAVCLLFFPNDQNLIGIEKIVGDIRANSVSDNIPIHFVLSNVPDIDDEDKILEKRMDTFQKKLSYSRSITIHHYANLALLNQSVFALARPNSRLAKEYRELADEIRSQNASDREAALMFLRKAIAVYGDLETFTQRTRYTDQVTRIETAHINDTEIDFYLARFKQTIGDFDESLALLERSIANGSRLGSAYINRSSLLASTGDMNKALELLEVAFTNPELNFTYLDVIRGLRLSLRIENINQTERLIKSIAVERLKSEDQAMVAYELLQSLSGAVLAEELIRKVFDKAQVQAGRNALESYFVFSLVAQGKLADAQEVLMIRERDGVADISDSYNSGLVSYWSGNSDLASKYFKSLIDFDKSNSRNREDANYLQCLSFAYWASGDINEALSYLNKSRKQSNRGENRIFSTWRYYKVLPPVFNEDLNEMEKLYSGKKLLPVFLRNERLI